MFQGFCIQISFFSLVVTLPKKTVMDGYFFYECSYQRSYSSYCVYFQEPLIKIIFSGTQENELELVNFSF